MFLPRWITSVGFSLHAALRLLLGVARLGLTHNDANLYAYSFSPGADGGIKGPNGDLYLYAHTQLDAQASYAVNVRTHLVVSALNLGNEVFGFYQGSPQYPAQREFYNRTLSVGLRLTR